MPIPITMPRLSDTMEEGTLVKWRVKVGDRVSPGDHLADVETDKATMELQAFDEGVVARLDVEEGQTVPVGKPILVLAEEGESVEEAAKAAAPEAEPKPTKKAEKE
ncbi:MAG TPA: biotin/lipoyl-containing protein, partial [Phycisphaeraceae bacterium]